MASLYVSVGGGTTTNLSDGNPFWMETGAGISSAPAQRHEQHGPLQSGVSDLGFRLAPRIVTLELHFYAATDAILDSHRDTLMSVFKPLSATSVYLYYERDDGITRRLTCQATESIDIELVPEQRPGHLHKATVKLRAADPAWLDTTVNTAAFPSNHYTNWWLAGGYIDAANVMEHVESPTQGQVWTYTGTITGDWSIAFRTSQASPSGFNLWPAVFHAGTGILVPDNASKDVAFYYLYAHSDYRWTAYPGDNDFGTTMQAGTRNYIGMANGGAFYAYYDGTAPYLASGSVAQDFDISGPARRWRSDRTGDTESFGWGPAVPKAAVFNIALSASQRVALDTFMTGTATKTILTSVNEGDLSEYPLITIRGPIQNPVIVNETIGGTLNLTGLILGSADTCTVDLRDGNKRLYDQNGNTLLGSITTPASLAKFYLAADPAASGGTNTIVVTGGSVSDNTHVAIEHYHHYVSF